MKRNQLLLIPLLIFMVSCATTPGHDPTLVTAQQTMTNAKATFDLILKTEYETYPAFKAANPGMAAKVRTFVNKIRADQKQWLDTAFSLTETYRTNRTETNKADLNTAIAVLQAAITQSNEYLGLLTPYKTT